MGEVIIKTPQENIVATLKGKKVLFIENDNGLYHGLEKLEYLLKEHKIKYTCLFEVDKMPMPKIIKAISKADAIVFQTQWVYKIAGEIRDFMMQSKDKKIVIEWPVGSEPTFYYKPEGIVHDVYWGKAPKLSFDEWKFYKLSQKAYWDYKNEFDK